MKRTKIREIWGISINVNAIDTAVDLPVCKSIQDIQEAKARDAHLQELKAYVMQGWQHKKRMWPIRHELAVIDGVAIKGK